MKKLIFVILLLLGFTLAETPKNGWAYVISAIGVKNSPNNVVYTSGDTSTGSNANYVLSPQVIVWDDNLDYVGSLTPFTGCLNSGHYTNGAPDGMCITGIINDLTTGGTDKALSAEQGKILNDKITSLQDITKMNFLQPSLLGSMTKNGVTLTNNGDGTYTLNGVSTTDIYFDITKSFVLPKGTYKLTGTPSNRGNSSMYEIIDYRPDLGEGVILEEDGIKSVRIGIVAYKGTYNNVIYKPMITKDLSATYGDFIPYKDSLVTGRDIESINKYTNVPDKVGGGKESFINNCKYLSSISEVNKPTMFVVENSGRGIVWGYTYESSENPSWAQYMYMNIGSPDVYVLWCWEHTWYVHRLNSTSI